MRAAVIGAGPAGFYTAQALLRRFPHAHIDILDALPVPFGLVRYGVAPDHPATKNATQTFSNFIRDTPNVSFLGNIRVADDSPITPPLLSTLYNLTIHATGAKSPRTLPIPLAPAVHRAHDFIFWLNAHPHHARRDWKQLLSARRVGIVGMGNVSLDVARLLLRPVRDLRDTDISPLAFDVLDATRVEEVCLFGRRGPQHAAWTTAALREMVHKIPRVVTRVSRALVESDMQRDLSRGKARMLKLLLQRATDDDDGRGVREGDKLLRLKFLQAPTAFSPTRDGVQMSLACGQRETIVEEEFEKVFLSLGYEAGEGPGIRVGWANGKARGIIGDNKWDAESVVASLPQPSDAPCGGLANWLIEQGHEFVTWEGWERIDEEERRRGAMAGREGGRVKIEQISEMLQLARGPTPMSLPKNAQDSIREKKPAENYHKDSAHLPSDMSAE